MAPPGPPRHVHYRTHSLRPGETRLAPPQLYPIAPRPPRRYGNAGAPFAFGLGAGWYWRSDRGYELFSDSARKSAFELFASYDVFAPGRWLVLAAGASFRTEIIDSDPDPKLELAQNALQADLTARLLAARWLWPQLRVGVGFIATRFRSDDERASFVLEDRDRGFLTTLGGGFTLKTPQRLFETYRGRLASLSLGLLFEGGYSFASAAELRAKPQRSSDVERVTFSLGKLDRAAPFLRVLAVIRF